eukprot:m.771179 g.771179  ORF g.771179 m.771179 type:complete len:62 (-) comp23244_c0_seq13:93-278(-)
MPGRISWFRKAAAISEDPVGGGTAFTQAAVNALGSIFARFDFDATGTIGTDTVLPYFLAQS